METRLDGVNFDCHGQEKSEWLEIDFSEEGYNMPSSI